MFHRTPTYISAPPTEEHTAFVFSIGQSFTISQVEFPVYAKGIFISVGKDGVLIAVDAESNLFTAFRNKSSWTARKVF